MYRVSKDGKTFKLIRQDVATYLFHSKLLPQESREATKREIEVYNTAHIAIWKKISNNMGLGRNIAQIFSINDEHVVTSITIDALLRCIENYDSTRGAKFSTYASRALYRSFQRFLKCEKKLYSLPKDDAYEVFKTEGKVKTYNEERFYKTVLDSAHFDFIEHDDKDMVQFLLNRLDEYDRHMLLLVYWKGLSMQQLADVLGVVKSTAWLDMQRILTLCRRIMKCES